MSAFEASKVFANLVSSKSTSPPKSKRPHMENLGGKLSSKDREIQVSATGEVSMKPDRCRLCVRVCSTKDNIEEAKTSISRRVDYIVQTLHNHGLKESDIQEYRTTQRVESAYRIDVEVHVQLSDFQKCQSISNLLVEKLDETVKVDLPVFYHATQSLENLRRQASLLAVHNAREKAQEIARFVHQSVGKPSQIREEEIREWEGSENSDPIANSIQQRISNKTVTISCKVYACFDMKTKAKSKYPDDFS